MTDEEIKNKAKETSGGNYYYEQGFIYGFELGEENGRKELEKENTELKDGDVARFEIWNKRLEFLEKENAELKAEIKQIIERERVVPEHYLCEMIDKNKELKAQVEKIEKKKKNCLDVMRVQESSLSDDYMAGLYNGMVVVYNSCFLKDNELEKDYCSKNEYGKWELAE